MTPLQAAALAALVAWRQNEKDSDFSLTSTDYLQFLAKLRVVADALLAEGGTG